MNTKTFAAALTALTLAATFAMPSNQAHAQRRALLGAGLVGAAIVGTAVAASSQPVYVAGPRRCKIVDQFDRWGNYLGTTKICRTYY